jgi:hypothetical protein
LLRRGQSRRLRRLSGSVERERGRLQTTMIGCFLG